MPIIYVLWTVMFVAMIASVLMPAATTTYQQAHNILDDARISAWTEAAVTRAVLSLLSPLAETRWPTDGGFRQFVFDGIEMRVALQDEAGKIDLNQADEALLTGLFRSAGLDPQTASGLTDKVLDWRESKLTRRVNGAKEAEYRLAGRVGPRGGAFHSADELKLVLGVTSDLFRAVEPAITILSGKPFVNPQVAQPITLAAIPGMGPATIAEIISQRSKSDPARNMNSAGIANPINVQAGQAFTITVEIPRGNRTVTRRATIRLTDNPMMPYWILDWQFSLSSGIYHDGNWEAGHRGAGELT